MSRVYSIGGITVIEIGAAGFSAVNMSSWACGHLFLERAQPGTRTIGSYFSSKECNDIEIGVPTGNDGTG